MLPWTTTELVLPVTTCQMLAGTLQVTSAEQSRGDFVNQCVLKGVDSVLLKVEHFLSFFFLARTTGRHRGLEKKVLVHVALEIRVSIIRSSLANIFFPFRPLARQRSLKLLNLGFS